MTQLKSRRQSMESGFPISDKCVGAIGSILTIILTVIIMLGLHFNILQ
jgi:hypothetical protein